MKTEPNEPINAQFGYDQNGLTVDTKYNGLTKREYFAATAMQGILSASSDRGEASVGNMAVKFADALIEALNKIKSRE